MPRGLRENLPDPIVAGVLIADLGVRLETGLAAGDRGDAGALLRVGDPGLVHRVDQRLPVIGHVCLLLFAKRSIEPWS